VTKKGHLVTLCRIGLVYVYGGLTWKFGLLQYYNNSYNSKMTHFYQFHLSRILFLFFFSNWSKSVHLFLQFFDQQELEKAKKE
jgi:hypothetical protein